ncbi:alanine-glyoxylate transaminase / serine-glyoxylate transaminase / serine-pyruvate transaminase [Methylacidimicrobium cyclopophantes]|uniref:Alanine-glyoxylate transaminase / serine-glyoxylate transaminase / serine-pyruvate transaminase n=2 Tax=Methylacidimicrobium cyclopophantes TaxID=1041766 RepID=A0A5E6MBE5_9BACT|nr:alanine-glyoxylate transaminase / serine-glyoxylate transaminase / serine-pyruvate transaminase [Methylacidimicrobium cyclopophantes]
MIGHRSKSFQELYADLQPKLQALFYTKRPVYFSTSSAWGIMEGAIRNLVNKKVLCCANGAFSDKWYDVALRSGKAAELLAFPWGTPVDPEAVRRKLATGDFDALTLIHNETSTGLMNPLWEIAEVMRDFPGVSFIVDTVSSFSVLKIPFDELGIDVMLAGTQKALALPPGAALFSVSERALAKAATVPGRGYYFDFIEFQKNHEKNMTPSTPSIGHFYALRQKLAEISAEGIEARYARHRENAQIVRSWIKDRGFGLFPKEGFASLSLTCASNTRKVDVAKWIQSLRSRFQCVIDGGYGKLKGETFRISHMGDETPQTVRQLLGWLDECLADLS